MIDSSPKTQFLCHQCAGVLPVEVGSQFVTCEFCGAENFIDKSGAVLHYALRATVEETAATAALRRWMGGNQTVKDLDKKAQIERPLFQLFPMWMVRVQQGDQEKVILEPAAALTVIELTDMSIPAADLEPFDPTLDAEAIAPTVPFDAVQKWLAENHKIAAGAIKESSLVHVPVYVCKYSFDGRSYTAVIDAATSKVYASVFPSKWEAPYFAIGSVGCVLYFLAALIPLFGFILQGFLGVGLSILIYIIVAALMAIPIFAIAAYISAKV